MKGSRKNHLYNSSFVLSFNGFWIYNKKYQKYQTGQSKKRKYKITAAKIKDDNLYVIRKMETEFFPIDEEEPKLIIKLYKL